MRRTKMAHIIRNGKEFMSVPRSRIIGCSELQYFSIPDEFRHNSDIVFYILDDITMKEKYGKDGCSPEYERLMKELEQNRNKKNESMKGRPEWLKKLWQ